MKLTRAILVVFVLLILSSFQAVRKPVSPSKFPYQNAGLTEREAAAHLLSRFTYGASPGDLDNVLRVGMEQWFAQQLKGSDPETQLMARLNAFPALSQSNREIAQTYYRQGQILRMATADGVIRKEDIDKQNKKAYQATLTDYMNKKGLKSERELIRQFVNQKILRSLYGENQLREVMTEFWFNHFNVSFTKGSCAKFIPNYERDVIRPNAFGSFEELLVATAHSPAMLLYLDNFISAAENAPAKNPAANRKPKGLNENYAREVMELHTLGVDGGYTQGDVTEAARVLTGWTIYPMGTEGYGAGVRKMLENTDERKLQARGFVHKGDFLFASNRHDKNEKRVLGKTFPAGGGYKEGVALLQMLAAHPSTAKFISRKIAIRFVSDNPSPALVDLMASTFTSSHGDITKVLTAMVMSAEFWGSEAVRAKTKSPFELVISSVRALDAEVRQPFQLFNWVNRMGQRIYFYQAPTGFPDRAQQWINTGALLNRMNFGLALADKRVPGLTFDLLKLNQNHEPESAEQALVTYSEILMPERPVTPTIERVTPLLSDPDLSRKIEESANQIMPEKPDSLSDDSEKAAMTKNNADPTKYRLSLVVGILLGSPEFQRR